MSALRGFSPLVRNSAWNRAEGCCERCGDVLPMCCGQHHHRRPRGAGGSRRPDTNQAANCLLLCGECHAYVESNRTEALASGWLISQHRKGVTPCEVPVQLHDGWFLLDNVGNKFSIPNPNREAS